jgi:N-acetyl-gamma-glutamyl-phosphate reductase
MTTHKGKTRVAILGASGYTGAELVRLLARHPNVEIAALTGDRKAGEPMSDVFGQFAMLNLPRLATIKEVDWSNVDAAFCALPHATTQAVVNELPDHVRVIDISADFRLENPDTYRKWYAHEHQALELQKEAVYGLTEFNRERIKTARIVACPGCYPTAALLPLLPLLEQKLIDPDEIIIDAKSGVSGAGRGEKQANLHAEVSEGIHAYGVGKHRHMPEIEQELSKAAGKPVPVTFTPHLMPMNRGMLDTIYVRTSNGTTAERMHGALAQRYDGEHFVHVMPFGQTPQTRHVRGSNHCFIGVVAEARPGRATLLSAIDNLTKGASGQGVQNFNLMFGYPETAGLDMLPLFP